MTTKASGNDIDVFAVGRDGMLSASPVVNSEPGTIPFGVTFDPAGHMVVAETGTNALATYALNRDGSVALLDVIPNGQSATCWVTSDGSFLFSSNTGSGPVSDYSVSTSGQLTLHGQTATSPADIDASATPDGRFLYVQAGPGIVDEFAVTPSGSLTEIGNVTVPTGSGAEGIVAS